MNGTFPMVSLGGLSTELTILLLSCILGFIQLTLASSVLTAERGARWNMGPRDEVMPPPGKLAGRLERAYRNFMETFPYFAAAILAAAITGRQGMATALGAELYLLARIIYVPLYAFGVTGLRTLCYLFGAIGLFLVIAGVFHPGIR